MFGSLAFAFSLGQRHGRVGVLVAIACFSACGGGGEARVFDFAAQVGQASVHQETRWIDLGEPFARAMLLRGWSKDESSADRKLSFVWATGASSGVRFYRFLPGDQLVRCQLVDHPFATGPMTIDVVVNGDQVASFQTRPPNERIAYRTHSFVIPEGVLRQGQNTMEFRYSGFYRPPPDATEQRELAVAWNWIEFGLGLGQADAHAEGDSLSIAGPTRLDYIVNVPPGSRLQWQSVKPWHGQTMPTTAKLITTIRWDDEIQRVETMAGNFEFGKDVALTKREGGRAVISFLAELDGTLDGNPKGMTIVAPRLVAAGPR